MPLTKLVLYSTVQYELVNAAKKYKSSRTNCNKYKVSPDCRPTPSCTMIGTNAYQHKASLEVK